MATKAHLLIEQGADFTVTIDVSDSNDEVFDLRDHEVYSQMRKNYASSSAITFDTSINGTAGIIYLSLSRSVTQDLEPGRYLYDVEVRDILADTVVRVVEGVVTVTPGMTRIP